MKRRAAFCFLAALCMVAAASGCKKSKPRAWQEPNSVLLVLFDNTGRSLRYVTVRCGPEEFSFPTVKGEISQWVKVPGPRPLSLRYQTDQGGPWEYVDEKGLLPEMAGGLLYLYFGDDGKVRTQWVPPS